MAFEFMEKYHYSSTERNLLENMEMPFAIYQFIDHRVVTLILSNGFLKLFGYEDRNAEYALHISGIPMKACTMKAR